MTTPPEERAASELSLHPPSRKARARTSTFDAKLAFLPKNVSDLSPKPRTAKFLARLTFLVPQLEPEGYGGNHVHRLAVHPHRLAVPLFERGDGRFRQDGVAFEQLLHFESSVLRQTHLQPDRPLDARLAGDFRIGGDGVPRNALPELV